MPSLREMMLQKQAEEASKLAEAKAKQAELEKSAPVPSQVMEPAIVQEPELVIPGSAKGQAPHALPDWVGVNFIRGLIRASDPNHEGGDKVKQNLAKSTRIFDQQMATREGLGALLEALGEIAYGKATGATPLKSRARRHH